MAGGMTKRRILFFAEAVTLAHVARPIALAATLDPERYVSFLACDARYSRFMASDTTQALPLHSISSAQFLKSLARGSPVYDLATLRDYLREDLALIDRIQPDLIVGDFRLSLSVGARLAGVPYAAVTNAYWSPHYRHRSFPMPVLPMTRVAPVALARSLFQMAQPLAFPLHCRPLNRLRTENGLASFGSDLRKIYTDADHRLYADDPDMFPLDGLPATDCHLGPVLWSPPMAVPDAWKAIDASRPTVYLTLGSSGSVDTARKVLEAVADAGMNLIVASAGASLPSLRHPRIFVSDFVPGDAAVALSQLVICNGGSPTSQQALAAGVPVLGIAGNMDQFLNMEGVVRAGAGCVLRADRIDHATLAGRVEAMLADAPMREAARSIGQRIRGKPLNAAFGGFLDGLLR